MEASTTNLLRDLVRIPLEAIEGYKPEIRQRAIRVDEKPHPLSSLLVTENGRKQVLVFVATRYACGHVANKLY